MAQNHTDHPDPYPQHCLNERMGGKVAVDLPERGGLAPDPALRSRAPCRTRRPPPEEPAFSASFFKFFGGLECVGPSFVYVAYL